MIFGGVLGVLGVLSINLLGVFGKHGLVVKSIDLGGTARLKELDDALGLRRVQERLAAPLRILLALGVSAPAVLLLAQYHDIVQAIHPEVQLDLAGPWPLL